MFEALTDFNTVRDGLGFGVWGLGFMVHAFEFGVYK